MAAFLFATETNGKRATPCGQRLEACQSWTPSVGPRTKPEPAGPPNGPPPPAPLAVDQKPVKRFRHSGRIGDVIYSLPAVRALGGGELYLKPEPRLGFTSADTLALIPLVGAQDYIVRIKTWVDEPVDFDLDVFRAGDRYLSNLADAHLGAFGLAVQERNRAWLSVPKLNRAATAVFARSLPGGGFQDSGRRSTKFSGRMPFLSGDPRNIRVSKISLGP